MALLEFLRVLRPEKHIADFPFRILTNPDRSIFDPARFVGTEIPSPDYPDHITGCNVVDSTNKYTRQVYCCVALVIIGWNGEEYVSALPHIATDLSSNIYLLPDDKRRKLVARHNFRRMIQTLQHQTDPATITTGLVGGNTAKIATAAYYRRCRDYLSQELQKSKIPLKILSPPNTIEGILSEVY
jgi:hypothetical protein